jgi:hypothetical protein
MDDPSYDADLAAIRRKRNQVLLAFLGYLPAMIALMLGVKSLGLAREESIATFAVLTWMALCLGLALRAGRVRCPRCHERFFFRRRFPSYFSNPYTSRCLNCGLSLKR